MDNCKNSAGLIDSSIIDIPIKPFQKCSRSAKLPDELACKVIMMKLMFRFFN